MPFKDLIKEKNISLYRLSKNCKIPYATLNDIVNGKSRLEKCSAETVYKLSKELGVTMEELLAPYVDKRCSFELFKSNVCHYLKTIGDVEFVIEVLEQDPIREYHRRRWYAESLYMLGMLDYISRENDIPICDDYDDLRTLRLPEPVYPESILAVAHTLRQEQVKVDALNEAIPEFKRFNIIESDVRNVV